MIPAAAVGLVSSIVIPAIAGYLGGGGGDDATEPPPDSPMNNSDLTTLLARAYVEEAYPKWQTDHPGKKCPQTIDELAHYFGDDPSIPVKQDPWGHDLVMTCDDTKGVTITSVGEDGKPGTADDVHAP